MLVYKSENIVFFPYFIQVGKKHILKNKEKVILKIPIFFPYFIEVGKKTCSQK